HRPDGARNGDAVGTSGGCCSCGVSRRCPRCRLFARLHPHIHPARHDRLTMSDTRSEMHERWILKTELLWAFGVGIFIAATLSMILFTALTISVNPPSNVERMDPKT